jgi:hypothetical protein
MGPSPSGQDPGADGRQEHLAPLQEKRAVEFYEAKALDALGS